MVEKRVMVGGTGMSVLVLQNLLIPPCLKLQLGAAGGGLLNHNTSQGSSAESQQNQIKIEKLNGLV